MNDPGIPDSEKIQTVGQLREWLKGFNEQDLVFGSIRGRPLINEIWCRHAQGAVIIETRHFVPLEPGEAAKAAADLGESLRELAALERKMLRRVRRAPKK